MSDNSPPDLSGLARLNMGGETKAQKSVATEYPIRAPAPVGKRISRIYKERIEQFYSTGQWQKQNLLAMMYEGITSGPPSVQLWTWPAPGLSRPSFQEAMAGNYQPARVGDSFGPSWATHWFKVVLCVPKDFLKKEHLEFQWDSNSEGMVWTEDGKPLQGLTGGGERIEWILPDSFRDGQEHTIYIEMACNSMFGNPSGGDTIQPPDPNKYFQLVKANICAVNMDARQLWIDTWIIGDAAREFPEDSWEQHEALNVVTDIIGAFVLGDADSIKKGRQIAQRYIGSNVDTDKVYGSGTEAQVFGIGHCHIDTCWLWPWAETKRKVARSWSSQCDLIDRYPEHHFACSQAQQYKWLKAYYPYAFDRVKEKVKQGRFHPIGGSWVEHDTNMPSGESLIRQFLYGQRFFESHFGERCRTFWLPDTFGYSSQLPQLCRLAGMDRFLTQKLSWNNINNFPHTTFNWVALDGSQVICHMPPSETYTAEAHFGDVKRSISHHKSMDQDHTSLLVFGKGDGGGGPTWQHIEKLRRCRGISDQIGRLPRVHMGNTVDDFFDKLQEKASSLVTWYGELYFELHRGTYTTQANNKLNNRRSETMLRDLELLATIASIKHSSYKYPKAQIDFMWEAVLLCQFHDCLPGSAIEMCYDDSNELYDEVFSVGKELFKDLYQLFGVSEMQPTQVGEAIALNTLPWPRKQVIDLAEGRAGVVDGSGNMINVKPLANKAVTVQEIEKGREVISEGGKANQLVIFDDKPLYWQAWDVEVYHLETRAEVPYGETKIFEDSEHRVSVVTEARISENSSIETVLSLSAAFDGQQSYVECTAYVDWHETMKFLKVEFPVDIRNTEASYETQYGIIKRPTHYNTSWDMAKFEVCCHKFADLSENGYGVSILNDCKYGFATCGNLMRLSLLRSPKAPDAHADMGKHKIRWAILPHQESLGPTTVRAGYDFNNPMKVLTAPPNFNVASFSSHPIQLEGDESLVIDCVKRGEDDEDVSYDTNIPRRKGQSVIIRIYDSLGGRSSGTVTTTWNVKQVLKTNALEDDGEKIDIKDGKFSVALRPFEVATYRLQL
ncbi:hypothetical protein O1611_g7180 [Lasiodiplodia mahajangana]|uniref:Uncharacterized protein n=1 Tax=Lasiodiplodia mahajangana TaxID=1108764 RepID=A0ACC2JG38_9PEZI|nr:hypothetical protein O1611_g7180 [Lasiodiplodia mahajangana]